MTNKQTYLQGRTKHTHTHTTGKYRGRVRKGSEMRTGRRIDKGKERGKLDEEKE